MLSRNVGKKNYRFMLRKTSEELTSHEHFYCINRIPPTVLLHLLDKVNGQSKPHLRSKNKDSGLKQFIIQQMQKYIIRR